MSNRDPPTREVVRRLSAPGADAGTAFDGRYLYQLAEGEVPSEVRRLGGDGAVLERLEVAIEAISAVEAAPGGAFWCGGEKGTLRLVRRKHAP